MSLRARLIFSYVLIIVLCLGIVAASLVVLLRDQINRMSVARLVESARPIYVQFRESVRAEVPLDEEWTHMEEMSQETETYIFLLDKNGSVIKQASPGNSSWQPTQLDLTFPPGNRPGPIGGIYPVPGGQTFIFVAEPVIGLPGATGPPGTVSPTILAMAKPYTRPLATFVEYFGQPFLWAGIVALAVSIIIAVLLARSVYIPVRRVTNAAEEIAKGHYEQEVPVDGPEEVQALAQSFNQMSKEVKRSQQMLRDFVADVSHELRSPLTSIKGFAQAIVDGTAKGKEAQLKAAVVIEDESKRMMRLVEELLEFSRLESGQIKMASESVDLKELLQQCYEIFVMRAEEKGVNLKIAVEALPPVTGDIDRLEQVFSNLLDNALKHTPSGGDVTITARQPNTASIEISITDTGPGISAEQMRHVFERFYKADPSAGKAGAGLGLAIARQIVLAHSGDINARSSVGKGTEFLVSLPTAAPQISHS